jgi:NADH-quinone oxidoreductase subunit E
MGDQVAAVLTQFAKDRANLVPILQKVQEAEGYLSPEAVSQISQSLNVSGNDVYSVASFYAQFRFERPGRHTIKVCQGTACHVRGGRQILDAVERELNLQPGHTTTDDFQFTLERVACVGSCALAPIILMDAGVYGRSTMAKARGLIAEYRDK